MQEVINHICGTCSDSNTHSNLLGFLLEPQFIQTIFNYTKNIFK
jgi:hypothetical protein